MCPCTVRLNRAWRPVLRQTLCSASAKHHREAAGLIDLPPGELVLAELALRSSLALPKLLCRLHVCAATEHWISTRPSSRAMICLTPTIVSCSEQQRFEIQRWPRRTHHVGQAQRRRCAPLWHCEISVYRCCRMLKPLRARMHRPRVFKFMSARAPR